MNETTGTMIPTPVEFSVDGRCFVQYGMSPVRMAALRAASRKDKKGTRSNPIIKNGKEYVYASDGRLIVLEHFDKKTVAHNTLPVETALTKEKIERLNEFEKKAVEPDDECPEISDDQIDQILKKAIELKKAGR